MNNNHHYEIALINLDGEKQIVVRQRIGDLTLIVVKEIYKEDTVNLKISGDDKEYKFYFPNY